MKLVVINEDGTHKEPSHENLKEYHPKCSTCKNTKGVHGQIGKEVVFCRVWDEIVQKTGYCNNHTLLQ